MRQNAFPTSDEARGFSKSLQLGFLAIVLITAGLSLALLG
jgi:hypothetical protein